MNTSGKCEKEKKVGKGVDLLAYTTGAPESWFDVFRLEPPSPGCRYYLTIL